jgi:hypothetical protein
LEPRHDRPFIEAPVALDGVLSPGRTRAVAVVIAIAFLLVGPIACRRSRASDAVTGVAGRFTLGEAREPSRTEFDRAGGPDVYYRVVLSPAPVGDTLRLDCAWSDPSGEVVRQNHYQTRQITTTSWETHCHQRFQPDAPPGTWRVELTREGRVLRQDSFALR